MRPRLFVLLAALRVVVAGSAVGAMPTHHPAAGLAVPNDWSALERATIIPGSKPGELTLELPAVDLPAGAPRGERSAVGGFPPGGTLYALRAEPRAAKGRQAPRPFLHHTQASELHARQ